MLTVLLQTLAFAASGLLAVGSMTLVILLLLSERGWINGLAYALGYFGGYMAIGALAVGIGYQAGTGPSSGPSRIVPLVLIPLGGLLLWMAFRNVRKPPEENPQPPRIFAVVDNITPFKALAFGALVTVINVKNLALILTALSIVVLSPLSLAQKLMVAFLAVFVFCLSVWIPVAIYLVFSQRAQAVLNGLKSWLERHSRPIGIWAPLIFGLIFILKGITDLP